MRIGKIPYLNCEPFFAHLQEAPAAEMPPRALGLAMRAGAVDAAPLSLVDLLSLGQEAVGLPYGIAVRGPVKSVLLFSHRPVSALSSAIISVTDETSTSVELLRVLLALRFEVVPGRWVGPGESSDAALLIGDAALRGLVEKDWPHHLDLAEEWTRWTGLPFVFARWGVRAAVASAERDRLARDLDRALTRAMEPAALRAIARRRRDTGLAEAEVAAYLTSFTYRLGPEEDKAVAEFNRLRGFVGVPAC